MDSENLEKIEQKIEEEFHVSRYIVIYKFGLGLIEFLLGLAIILGRQSALVYYENFKATELMEDPRDLLVQVFQRFIPYLLNNQTYIVILLLSFGLVKIIGAIGLIYKKRWGIDLLVGLIIAMAPFQLYKIIIELSFADLFYLLTGILIGLYLINFKPKEYAVKLHHRINRRILHKADRR